MIGFRHGHLLIFSRDDHSRKKQVADRSFDVMELGWDGTTTF